MTDVGAIASPYVWTITGWPVSLGEMTGPIVTSAGRAAAPGWPLILLLGLITSLDAMAVDTYLPAMPAAATSLGASEGEIQQTLSLFLFGLAAGHGIYGPLADRLGRRVPLLAGLAIFCLGSVIAALAGTVEWLLIARLIQALGAAAGLVIPRAIVHDLTTIEASARIFSFLMQITMIAPLIGPVVGGVMLNHGGWRVVFWALLGVGAVALLWATRALPDSLPREHRVPLSPASVVRAYARQLASPGFTIYALSGGLLFGAIIIYLNTAPFLLITQFHLTPTAFGLFFASNALGIIITGQCSTLAMKRFDSRTVVQTGMIVQTIPPLLLLAIAGFFSIDRIVYIGFLAGSIWLMGLSFGGIIALTMAQAGPQTGVASALMGLTHYFTAALIGLLTSFLAPSRLTLPAGLALCGCLAAIFCAIAGRVTSTARERSDQQARSGSRTP